VKEVSQMNRTTMEALEPRLLLSAGVLTAGQTAVFDFDANGTDDAVLANLGVGDIEYEFTAGSTGFDTINATADGAAFRTNTWVGFVDDNSAADDFDLAKVQLGKRTKFGGVWYDPIAGDSYVNAGSIDLLELGTGGSLGAMTSEGDFTEVLLRGDTAVDLFSIGALGTLCAYGDLTGSVYAMTDIGTLVADEISGASILADGAMGTLAADRLTGGSYVQANTLDRLAVDVIDGASMVFVVEGADKISADTIADATIILGTDLNRLCARTIAGSESGTSITVGGHVNRLQANTITGGVNGTLDISIGAGLDRLSVGLLEGGQAVDGGFASTNLAVMGTLDKFYAGLISGGQADGADSFVMLNISVDDLWGDEGLVEAGDIGRLRASAISGGDVSDYGEAMLFLNVGNDLINTRVGQLIGSGTTQPAADPSVFITVGHDIVKFVAGEITAGTATGDGAYSSVWITAGNDIQKLSAGRIDGGTADGEYSTVEVWITAGRDINWICANTFSGGISNAEGAMAGVYVQADRNIDFIGATLISGTQATRRIWDPTVQFIAGGDIGMVLAGRITGGNVIGEGAAASVLLRAEGTWVDPETGEQSAGNIGKICAGTITGGNADGEGALSHVTNHAANDIEKLYADRISGGTSDNGGNAFVDIVAEHDIVDLRAGTIIGSENGNGGSDPGVQIQAYNDIKNFLACRIIAGEDGQVNILAGIDGDGNVSGENGEAGSIENMVVHMISGNGGVVNIAAGGDIEYLKACRIVSGDGEVNISAGDDMTVDVRRVRSWSVGDETGVQFNAGGEVDDVRGSIRDKYVTEGEPVDLPEPMPGA